MYAGNLGKNNYQPASTLFAHKGNYLAIREISLSYSLPQKWTQAVKMQRAEVSITGQNLGYITSAKNVFSPETGANGVVSNGYALPKSVLFGVNLTF